MSLLTVVSQKAVLRKPEISFSDFLQISPVNPSLFY